MKDNPTNKTSSQTSEIQVLTIKMRAFAIFFIVSSVTILSLYFFTDILRDVHTMVYVAIIAGMLAVIYFATKARKSLERVQSDSKT